MISAILQCFLAMASIRVPLSKSDYDDSFNAKDELPKGNT
jgi:hypothetical protein